MAQKLMTPGVYIEEVNAFPGSVVEVATAVPAFIGYTEKAERNGKTLVNKPTRITSFAEYRQIFGGAFSPMFTLDNIKDGEIPKHEITINGQSKAINYLTHNDAYMFRSIQLFFNNGGGTCYIVSVGTYSGKKKVEVKQDAIEGGLATLLKEQEPTMVLIPEAIKLDNCYDVYKKVLAHCAKMQSRVAILDIKEGDSPRINSEDVDIIKDFRMKVGTEYLNFAAAYYPWLNTNIVQKGEITFENLNTDLKSVLPESEEEAYKLIDKFPADDNSFIDLLTEEKPSELESSLMEDVPELKSLEVKSELPEEPEKPDENASDKIKNEYAAQLDQYKKDLKTYNDEKSKFDTKKDEIIKTKLKKEQLKDQSLKATKKLFQDFIANKKRNYHLGLVATSPTYVNLLEEISNVVNILPPSAAMAGIYTTVDNNRGVWKAPANISLNSVVKPTVNITHDEQETLNVDATSGKSINAIRTFPGIGTLVWGARTLDGNSLDWKYINVRRTMIMLEQSIKLALRSYVFEPNDSNTWITVKSMIVNFLNEKWKQGALAGSTPEDAFDVQVGLGATMTSLDILEGKMLVSVKLAIVRPAEFIVVTFEQQMQKS
jgi:phage tail sheath protein FI